VPGTSLGDWTNLNRQYENSSEFWLQFRLAAGRWAKLRCAASYALLPSDADGVSLLLPPSMYFLYYAYRPARLAVNHGARLLKSIPRHFARTNHAAGA
jgi:hypothetical protein